MTFPRATVLLILLAVLAGGCGDEDDEPRFVTVPLTCDERLDRLEDRAAGWPDPATLADLQGVNDDLFAVLDGLDEDCDPAVFERLDRIECGYLTTVTGADAAAETFLAAQQERCREDPVPEPEPGDPVATIEPGG